MTDRGSEHKEGESTPLPEGVRGRFDTNALKDYAPAFESSDPLMHIDIAPFEGPLDLLLHIIRRDAINIFDIPIAGICAAYLQALKRMRDLNIDVAAEFLVMAATLAHLKSKLLLPKEAAVEEEEEDGIDPRAELVRRLLEYQKFKRVAAYFDGLGRLGRDVFARPTARVAEEELDGQLADMDAMELVAVLARIFKRSKKKVVHEVFAEHMSIGARINELIDVFKGREHLTFEELLTFGEDPIIRSKRVITFLALLEMARLKLIEVHQPRDAGTIYVVPIHANLNIDPAEIKSGFDGDYEDDSASTESNDVQ
jgi:segregation and condensation protein A